MAVKDERMRILKMIEEGKLSAEEGVKLLEALEEPETAQKREVPLFHRRAEGARVIRIRVTDVATEKVKVNISVPFTVVEFLQAFIPKKEKEKMEEKGIDVRLALDVLDLAHRKEYDVALIFSQDQDLSELADLIRALVGYQNRWIKIASAYPDSPTRTYRRGINRTDWCPIDRATYDACLDPLDYRP